MRKYQGDNRSELGTIVIRIDKSCPGEKFQVEICSRPQTGLGLKLQCSDVRIFDTRPGRHEKADKIFQNYMHAIKRMNDIARDLENWDVSESGAADELKMVATILKEIVSKSNMWFK